MRWGAIVLSLAGCGASARPPAQRGEPVTIDVRAEPAAIAEHGAPHEADMCELAMECCLAYAAEMADPDQSAESCAGVDRVAEEFPGADSTTVCEGVIDLWRERLEQAQRPVPEPCRE